MTMPLYLSVDLDYFADMRATTRWEAMRWISTQISSTLSNVTLMRDHLPLSIRGWSPRTLKQKNALIMNLDEHDDAGTGALGIGTWMSRYLEANVRAVWVVPPGSTGYRCGDSPRELLVQYLTNDRVVPDGLNTAVEAAFFVSPAHMHDRKQAREAVLDLLFCLERDNIKVNNKPVAKWTMGDVIELIR